MKYNKIFLLVLVSGCSSYQFSDIDRKDEFKKITFSVPKNYTVNNTEKIKLNALIHKAKKNRIGLLVVNYGGPGAGAVDAAYNMINYKEFPESIIERFDILAIDPRGTGSSDFSSEMIKCHFNENCNEDKESVSQYVSTTKFVHDIDYIRKELNEDKINFLGYSYGTKIGQLYSFFYPNNVRSMILDSPVSIEHNNAIEESMTIPLAYERIMRYRLSFDDVSSLNKINNVIKEKGYFLTNDGYKINQEKFNFLLSFVIHADLETWNNIKPLISDFFHTGDAPLLYREINRFNFNKAIEDEELEAISSINCTDERKPLFDFDLDNSLPLYEKKSSLFGSLAKSDYAYMCYNWYGKRDPIPYVSKINNKEPILIIGGNLDKLTPYEEAIKVNELYSGPKKLISVNNLVDHGFSFSNKDSDLDLIAEEYLLNPNSIIN